VLRTIDRREPENDTVKPVRGERANCAEQAKYENCEKDCLPRLTAVALANVSMIRRSFLRRKCRHIALHGVHNDCCHNHL
jgi:hypothetical protein